MLEIHPHRIVQNLETGLGLFFLLFFFGFFFDFLETIDFGRFDDFDLHFSELAQNRIQLIRVRYPFGQHIIEIIERDVTLLLCQLGQLTDSALQIVRPERDAIGFVMVASDQDFLRRHNLNFSRASSFSRHHRRHILGFYLSPRRRVPRITIGVWLPLHATF